MACLLLRTIWLLYLRDNPAIELMICEKRMDKCMDKSPREKCMDKCMDKSPCEKCMDKFFDLLRLNTKG